MRMMRSAALVSGLVLAVVGLGASAGADPSRPDRLPQSSPTITAAVVVPWQPGGGGEAGDSAGSADGRDDGASTTGDACWSEVYEPGSVIGNMEDDAGLTYEDALALSTDTPPTARLHVTSCPGEGISRYWVPGGLDAPPTITVDDLVPGAYNDAVSGIAEPTLDMSPPADVGGIVNLGLWLAIEEPAPVTARAEAGAVWAQATATLTGITWDMGNGDVVECDGYGDPIVDLTVEEQSPVCGYTFEFPSAPEYTGAGLAYEMSVTAHWNVQITGSDGRNESAGTVDSVHEFLFPVCEVQTLGAAPGSGNPTEGQSCAEAVGMTP